MADADDEAPIDLPPSAVNPEPPLCLLSTEASATSEGKAAAPRVAEENSPAGGSADKVRIPRWVPSDEARKRLEGVYQQHKFPTLMMREQLSTELQATLRQIQVWFQNRRQRDQRQQNAILPGAVGWHARATQPAYAVPGGAPSCPCAYPIARATGSGYEPMGVGPPTNGSSNGSSVSAGPPGGPGAAFAPHYGASPPYPPSASLSLPGGPMAGLPPHLAAQMADAVASAMPNASMQHMLPGGCDPNDPTQAAIAAAVAGAAAAAAQGARQSVDAYLRHLSSAQQQAQQLSHALTQVGGSPPPPMPAAYGAPPPPPGTYMPSHPSDPRLGREAPPFNTLGRPFGARDFGQESYEQHAAGAPDDPLAPMRHAAAAAHAAQQQAAAIAAGHNGGSHPTSHRPSHHPSPQNAYENAYARAVAQAGGDHMQFAAGACWQPSARLPAAPHGHGQGGAMPQPQPPPSSSGYVDMAAAGARQLLQAAACNGDRSADGGGGGYGSMHIARGFYGGSLGHHGCAAAPGVSPGYTDSTGLMSISSSPAVSNSINPSPRLPGAPNHGYTPPSSAAPSHGYIPPSSAMPPHDPVHGVEHGGAHGPEVPMTMGSPAGSLEGLTPLLNQGFSEELLHEFGGMPRSTEPAACWTERGGVRRPDAAMPGGNGINPPVQAPFKRLRRAAPPGMPMAGSENGS